MSEINWKALDNFPLLLYILAAKTLILCLAFAGAKIYQSRRVEAQRLREASKNAAEKKDE
ncbi:small integral membrane protein 11A [Ornithorhynchus anatinus]|uniref:small integral membrane protein 11A n=1 Tax=Ornithorhynchus anatinus TaxID=9258 RepID=UPI00015A984B|nr:small integral membrane protein 11A [Ornithorhynchus anatinus]